MRKNIKIRLLFISVFTIFYSVILSMSFQDREIEINKELKIVFKKFTSSFFAIEHENHLEAKTTSSIIDQDEVIKDMMNNLITADDYAKFDIREKFRKHLYPLCNMLKKEGVSSLQIALSNNESFLKMDNPNEYGDNLSLSRETFKKLLSEKKPLYGLEYDKEQLHYRYLFPFFNSNNEYLGSFEIAYSLVYMQELMKSIDNITTDLFLKNQKFTKDGWQKQYGDISKKRKLGKEFSLYIQKNNLVEVATFFPLKNFKDGETLGYIVSYSNNQYINNILKRYYNKHLINFFLLLIITILLYKVFMYQKNIQEELEEKVQERTKKLAEKTDELKKANKKVNDSIEYASLIQKAILPREKILSKYTKEHFIYWEPKDIVGGDIYFIVELDGSQEILILSIDCTGHGVPGALVTMIVKAIEREVVSKIRETNKEISPAWIMSYFNKTMKILLQQETQNNLSDTGIDGSVIYYNKVEQIIKFTGASTALFYIDENEIIHTVKGDRYSAGYNTCAIDYQYKEHIIKVKEGMKFYCTTDGYIDQTGGNKGFPFGKKRFLKIISENHQKPMDEQKRVFINEITQYEQMVLNNERKDDITLIAFEIDTKSEKTKVKMEEIIKYEGVITNNVIALSIDNIKSKILNKQAIDVITAIITEYCQNIMRFSKDGLQGSQEIVPEGEIDVQCINGKEYTIKSKNIVSQQDRIILESKLNNRRDTDRIISGTGIYKIINLSDSITYEFIAINEDKYFFIMKSLINITQLEDQ